jgi:transcriptional regulator with XRE-family HTH domain
MLVVETIARIRFEFFSRGKKIKQIARELGVARDTVRKVVRSGQGFHFLFRLARGRGYPESPFSRRFLASLTQEGADSAGDAHKQLNLFLLEFLFFA